MEISSWLRETARLTLRYLAVGVSFIPAGLVYGGFRRVGWDSPVSVALSLVFGFWIASLVWNRLEIPQRVPAIPPISKELAVLISDSMVENWADAVEARSKKAEQLRLYLYDIEVQGQLFEGVSRKSLQRTFGQILNVSRGAIPRPTMGVQQNAAFGGSSS
jgi:hypothetical protein